MTAPPRWPHVAVITPTWQRHDLLLGRCVPSVAGQDYPGQLTHVIVSDGPDPGLAKLIADLPSSMPLRGLVFVQLTDHDPASRWGHRCRLLGVQLAATAGAGLLCWLDDDNAHRPGHVRRIAETAAAHPGAGLIFSRIEMHVPGGGSYLVGWPPPQYGQIDTSAMATTPAAHAAATWRDEGQPTIDWDLAERMLAAGVTWAHLPEVTADYYFAGAGP